MSDAATDVLRKFESLIRAGKIDGFDVFIKHHGLLIRSTDGIEEQVVMLDSETFTSVEAYFDGLNSIKNDSFDYTSLKSLINAKAILDRMLHNKELGE
jgi:hypothetical protein